MTDTGRNWQREALVALLLTALVAVGGLAFYYVTNPCLPWQEVTQVAGGTLCDGRKAATDVD